MTAKIIPFPRRNRQFQFNDLDSKEHQAAELSQETIDHLTRGMTVVDEVVADARLWVMKTEQEGRRSCMSFSTIRASSLEMDGYLDAAGPLKVSSKVKKALEAEGYSASIRVCADKFQTTFMIELKW